MFEKVNKAYEFLCTKSTKILDGPDPENIILILKTQSILFNRHKQGKLHGVNMLFPHTYDQRYISNLLFIFNQNWNHTNTPVILC